MRSPSHLGPSPISEAVALTCLSTVVMPGPDPLGGPGSARPRMRWRAASFLHRLSAFGPPPWSGSGPGRVGVPARGYVCGVGWAGTTMGTGGKGSRCGLDAGLLQTSSLPGVRSEWRRPVLGLRWRHSGQMNVGVNKAIIECRAIRDGDGLLAIVRKQTRGQGKAAVLKFDCVNCATWLNGWSKLDLARLRGPCPAELLLVLERVLHLLKTQAACWRPREVANAANGICKLQYKWAPEVREHLVVMDALAQWSVLRGLGEFTPQEISNLANSFAKLKHHPGEALLDMISRECVKRGLQEFKPQEISNLANSFAKLEHFPGEALLEMISRECGKRGLQDFNPQNLSNLANAFAKFGRFPSEALFEMISRECVGRGLKNFAPQAIANIANAFAKLNYTPGEALLRCIGKVCKEEGMMNYRPDDISTLLNAFAKYRFNPGKEVLNGMARECTSRQMLGFNAQATALIVNAYAALEHYSGQHVYNLICQESVSRNLTGFDAQNIANLLHGLASLRHHPGSQLLDLSISRCLALCFEGFHGHELSNVLQALALCDHGPSEAFIDAFLERCRNVGWGTFSTQGLTVTVWSLMVLKLPVDKGLLQEVLARIRDFRVCAIRGDEGLDFEGWLAVCVVMKQWVSLTDGEEEPGLREEVGRLWEMVGSRLSPPTHSKLQWDAYSALEGRGYRVLEEVMLSDGVVSVDMVITVDEAKRVGVEVDGPSHFFHNRPQEPMGNTLLKRRLMDRAVERGELQGWVSVRDAGAEAMRQVEDAVNTVERSL